MTNTKWQLLCKNRRNRVLGEISFIKKSFFLSTPSDLPNRIKVTILILFSKLLRNCCSKNPSAVQSCNSYAKPPIITCVYGAAVSTNKRPRTIVVAVLDQIFSGYIERAVLRTKGYVSSMIVMFPLFNKWSKHISTMVLDSKFSW